MSSYFLKVYAVYPGKPRESWEYDAPTEYFQNRETAENVLDWWKGDQGRKDSIMVETTVECAVVDGVVIIPTNVTR